MLLVSVRLLVLPPVISSRDIVSLFCNLSVVDQPVVFWLPVVSASSVMVSMELPSELSIVSILLKLEVELLSVSSPYVLLSVLLSLVELEPLVVCPKELLSSWFSLVELEPLVVCPNEPVSVLPSSV